MYKFQPIPNCSYADFCASSGIPVLPKNEWVDMANIIPWDDVEELFARNFPSPTGNPAKPFRLVLGTFILQNCIFSKKNKPISDNELVKRIGADSRLQYFLGLPKYQNRPPFTSPALVAFRKRLNSAILLETNKRLVQKLRNLDTPESRTADNRQFPSLADDNAFKIIDETSAIMKDFPAAVNMPQTYRMLHHARKKLERMIDFFHATYAPWPKPRTYRKVAQAEYEEFAKTHNKTPELLKSITQKQLAYIKRDLKHLAHYIDAGFQLKPRFINNYQAISQLYSHLTNKKHAGNGKQTVNQIAPSSILSSNATFSEVNEDFCSIYKIDTDSNGYTDLTRYLAFVPSSFDTGLHEALMLIKMHADKDSQPNSVIVGNEDWNIGTKKSCNSLGYDFYLKRSDWIQNHSINDIPSLTAQDLLCIDQIDSGSHNSETNNENDVYFHYIEDDGTGYEDNAEEIFPCLITREKNGTCPLHIAKLVLLKNMYSKFFGLNYSNQYPYTMTISKYDKDKSTDGPFCDDGKEIMYHYGGWRHYRLLMEKTIWWITLGKKDREIDLFP